MHTDPSNRRFRNISSMTLMPIFDGLSLPVTTISELAREREKKRESQVDEMRDCNQTADLLYVFT